jgi:hypothetical protein
MYLITPEDRACFRRCRRQWDFAARSRRNLEPRSATPGSDLERALVEALAVYYFPGMWDWDRRVVLPLVRQGFERALSRGSAPDRGWEEGLALGLGLLEEYFEWAPGVDRFSPVLIEAEYEVTVEDPGCPGQGLVTPGGDAVRYRGKIDLLAVDRHDEYWIFRHRLVEGDWAPVEALLADDGLLTACWAWEQFYPGMAVAGTVDNEIRLSGPDPEGARARRLGVGFSRGLPGGRRGPVRQHEPSGGGRSIPQHQRVATRVRRPSPGPRIEREEAGRFRRTWIRRTRQEVAGAGRQLGTEAADMIRPDLVPYPSPSEAVCPFCSYLPLCAVVSAGQDPEPLLRTSYRVRPPDRLQEGRLGGGAWSMGRGAAPPRMGSNGRS